MPRTVLASIKLVVAFLQRTAFARGVHAEEYCSMKRDVFDCG